MPLISALLDKPAQLSTASKYTAWSGAFYLVNGLGMTVWPGLTQSIFLDQPFMGHDEALMRVIGMLLAVIGWFYIIGGRSGGRQIVAASVFDRLTIVPLVLIPTAISGVFPHVFYTFSILDPALGLLAWFLLKREISG
ncbi:MAG: hypothetical protein P4L54_06285 [Acidocella sp.]|nr:hypothetical protein [Acidocella sp.]